ncbi:hypothetical protein JCGZ_19663 [Jatropha curcas]|uniref:Aminotransferase-like plant mobile domain-containing protein n=1 Tax=Jatropha curcas TaxID=180498 RepID=A0A067K9K3_JATCU|nr:hypothetical protein JCGZ_19663 [Jatropha curcas]
MQLTFCTVAAYPYKQCRPLHGLAPEVSASLELRDATKSAVTQWSIDAPSIWQSSSKLGSIGLEDTSEARFDRPEGFECLVTFSARGKDPEYWRSFLNDRELSALFLTPWDCEAWRTHPGREVAELHTRSRLLMRGYWADRYFLGERVYDTPVTPAQRRVPHAPPRHMCLLEGLTREDLEVEYRGFSANDFLSVGDFLAYFSSRMQARLPEIFEYTQERKTHKTAAHYRAEAAAEVGAAVAPARLAGIVPGDVPFPPGMEVVLDPDLGLGSGITIPADLRRAPPLPQLDPEHATHDLEIGRLRRHQSPQSSAVSRLQAEVDRLRTRLEVEGIPLDSSDKDDDGSSDDAPLSPAPQAAAGPSRRQR